MKITNYSIDNPLTTVMLVVAMLFLGYISLIGLPIDLFPELEFPLVSINTVYKGASPTSVEKLVTKKIEEAVTSLEDIQEVQSASYEGVSFVVVRFKWNVNIDLKAIDVREKVDLVRQALPDDAEDPIVSKFDIMSNESVIVLSAISKKNDIEKYLKDIPESERESKRIALREQQLQDTRKFVEDEVKDRLERVQGVASAKIIGGLEREIQITVRPHDLQYYGLSMDDISKALKDDNVELPGGRIDESSTEYTVRLAAEFKTIEDIEQTIIKINDGKAIFIKDVADVIDTHKEVREYSRTNGIESVGIEVIKRSGGNSVQIAEDVKKEIERINKLFPDYNIAVSIDYSQYIKDSIGMVKSNAIMGALFSTIVLLIFLRNIKSTLIVGMTIPTALVVTFFLIAQKKMTLNLLSLGGLALGVGMLVDNAIVILENIFRHISTGEEPLEGAKKGAHEVGTALTGSTFTTLAVFVPIIFFTTGIVNQIFSDLAYTVTFSIAASLLVAVTFVPMAAARLLRKNTSNPEITKKPVKKKDSKKSFLSLESVQNFLEKGLRPMIKHRFLSVTALVIMLVLAFYLLSTFMKMEFFPNQDQGVFSVSMELGTGRSLQQTDEKTRLIEERISRIPKNILENFFVKVNTGNKPNESMVGVKLVKAEERDISVTQIVDEIRSDLANKIPGAKITVTEGERRGPQGKDIELIIKGDSLSELTKTSNAVMEILSKIDGAVDIDTSLRIGKPEIRVDVNRKQTRNLMLTANRIADTIRKYLTGEVPTTFKQGDDEIDIRLKISESESLKSEDIASLLIALPSGQKVRLEEVADIYNERGPVVLERKDQQRMARITANLRGGKVLGEVTGELENELKKYNFPEGQSYEFAGAKKDMQESFASLFKSLAIAIVLVYMILVSQFESLTQPFVIMATLPQGLIGVVVICVLTGTSLNIMVMLGMLILTGIVVNNAIVLITYYNQLRHTGMERIEALILASRTRLRPILMTTLTTSAGMLPLALGFGSGAEFYSPLAITIIGGMIFSTFGTLFICPVLDTYAEDFGSFVKRKLARLVQIIENLFWKIFSSRRRKGLED